MVEAGGEGKAAPWVERGLLAVMALAVGAVMLGPLHRLLLHIPRGYNEGWNAYHALAAMNGSPLYPDAHALVANNYPPLSFYILGLAGRLFGDYIFPGRVLSLIAQMIVAWNVYRLARLCEGTRFCAAFSAVLFLLYVGVYAMDYVAMNDPQWVGHAFVTSGVVLFLQARRNDQPTAALFIASALCVAGMFVKHNLVALPVALFVWSLAGDRRGLRTWTLMSLGLGLAGLALCTWVYGAVFLVDVLAHARVLSPTKWFRDLGQCFGPMTPLAVDAALLALVGWGNQMTRLTCIYAACGTLFGLFFLAGEGCDINVLFDAIIAASICAGLFVGRVTQLIQPAYRQLAPAALALATAAVCLPGSVQALVDSREMVRQDHGQRRDFERLIGRIRAAPGPVACELLSLCYWAGREFELDFFNYGQKLKTGAENSTLLQARIETRHYAYIETIGPPAPMFTATTRMLGVPMGRVIDQNYAAVAELDDQLLLAPRPRSATPIP